MSDIVTLARERADRFGIKNVVVCSIGVGANLVCDAFDPSEFLVIAVGNSGENDEERREYATAQKILEDRGAKVTLQPFSLFQALDWGKEMAIGDGVQQFPGGDYDEPILLNELIESPAGSAAEHPVGTIYRTLERLFGDGPRMCIESALMAADSGLLPLDRDCISIDRPSPKSNCPHAAMVLRPTCSNDILTGRMRVKDMVLVPQPNDHWFSDGPLWDD